ncbi:hypothetical protein GmHk_03G006763 [Glycine max]|nr:hypothetical protein GmHk_03G006763 [Glycine max]
MKQHDLSWMVPIEVMLDKLQNLNEATFKTKEKPNGVTSKSFSTEEEHEQNRKSDHRLKDCSIDILMLDKIIIASYGGNIESEPHELAKLMIVDGCLLLELLIMRGDLCVTRTTILVLLMSLYQETTKKPSLF